MPEDTVVYSVVGSKVGSTEACGSTVTTIEGRMVAAETVGLSVVDTGIKVGNKLGCCDEIDGE